MELSFLHIADYANITDNGKLNIMGIFDNITAANFPAAHPDMFLVIRLTAQAAEYNRKFKLGIKLIDEDATKEIINLAIDQVVPQASGGQKVNLNQVVRLANVVFPKPGTYEFSVLVNEDVKGTIPIELIQRPT